MAKKGGKIEGTDEAWETGKLGRDEEFAQVAKDVDELAIDQSLDLQLVSIRLQKSLIEDFKMLAKLNGLGYQPLMRQVLKRFADSEKKRIMNQMIHEQTKRDNHEPEPEPEPQLKRA